MTKKQQEIEAVKREIALLNEKLAKLEELPEYDENEKLYDMPGFPQNRLIHTRLCLAHMDTLGALLSANENKLWRVKGLGEKSVPLILAWMKEYGFEFYDQL